MRKAHNTFLIASFVLLVIAGVYSYFSHGQNSEAAGSLTPTTGSITPPILGGGTNQIALDTAFLSSLVTLNKIKVDNSLFSNQAFKSLHDNTVSLEQAVAGRPDPFAPLDQQVSSQEAPSVVVTTNEPSQITNKTVIFNGAIATTDKVQATYFEYGPTPSLGQVTPMVSQSLVATFVAKVGGLSSQTVYFYRAAAKVNGAIIYGDIISFNTK